MRSWTVRPLGVTSATFQAARAAATARWSTSTTARVPSRRIHRDPGRDLLRDQKSQAVDENAFPPERREGRIPRHLEAEVAGARGMVSGRGR